MLMADELGDVWIYIVGPGVGGVPAAVLADFLLTAFRRKQQ
jgi:glycerol uptake facilitator-like aquaporin